MRTLGRRDVASIIAAITCLASCGGLTACAEETPEPFLVGMPERAVGNSPMPERYADAFARYLVRELDDFGRKTERKPIPADRRIRQVRSGEITVSYGCTGELLEHLDRNRAMELRREYKKQGKARRLIVRKARRKLRVRKNGIASSTMNCSAHCHQRSGRRCRDRPRRAQGTHCRKMQS